jgi:hypothetical protein
MTKLSLNKIHLKLNEPQSLLRLILECFSFKEVGYN